MISEPTLKDFVDGVLANLIFKPATTIIRKIFAEKEFLTKNGTFKSEVDASIFPVPSFVYTFIKTLRKLNPQIFQTQRNLLSNSVSTLIGFALMWGKIDQKDKKTSEPIKYLNLAAYLLTEVRSNMEVFLKDS